MNLYKYYNIQELEQNVALWSSGRDGFVFGRRKSCRLTLAPLKIFRHYLHTCDPCLPCTYEIRYRRNPEGLLPGQVKSDMINRHCIDSVGRPSTGLVLEVEEETGRKWIFTQLPLSAVLAIPVGVILPLDTAQRSSGAKRPRKDRGGTTEGSPVVRGSLVVASDQLHVSNRWMKGCNYNNGWDEADLYEIRAVIECWPQTLERETTYAHVSPSYQRRTPRYPSGRY